MLVRAASFLGSLLCLSAVLAQGPPPAVSGTAKPNWQTPSARGATFTPSAPSPASGDRVASNTNATGSSTAVGTETRYEDLPNNHGQQWRKYDISPYTNRVASTKKPEQAVIDWILRETGTDIWFTEPLGLLSASKDTLYVYHTPEMQQLVAEVVDRFVSSEAEPQVFSLQLITIGSPNWRSKAHSLLQPVNVESPGVDAWLLSKENAAVLKAELEKRTDFSEHNAPTVMIHNGQSHTLARTRPKNYVRAVNMLANTWPGHTMEMGQIDEGYSLQLSPLMSLDGASIDAVIKCHIDQIEKLVPIAIDVPPVAGQRQRVQIQVPQMVSWRLHERFRWPSHAVLLLSCGVVAAPSPDKPNPLGVPNVFKMGPDRADALLFIEYKGKASQTLLNARTQSVLDSVPNNRGRY